MFRTIIKAIKKKPLKWQQNVKNMKENICYFLLQITNDANDYYTNLTKLTQQNPQKFLCE